jgi:hypothetical protein
MLEHPPNISEFDSVSTKTIISKSPLLQARINAMRKEKVAQPANEPIQVHIYNQGQPQAGGSTGIAPVVPQSNGLIPVTHVPGARLEIQAFVEFYQLPSSFLHLFMDNAITGTHAFFHITTDDLKTMGFKFGEIIDLKEAIMLWGYEK